MKATHELTPTPGERAYLAFTSTLGAHEGAREAIGARQLSPSDEPGPWNKLPAVVRTAWEAAAQAARPRSK